MANEGTLAVQLNMSKSGTTASKQRSSNFTITGTRYTAGKVTVGTSGASALSLPSSFGTPGFAIFINHDSTNYVEIGNHNGGSPIYTARLKAGESALLRLTMANNAINLRANTASCEVEYVIFED